MQRLGRQLAHAGSRRSATISAELHTTPLRGGQRSLGALRCLRRLILCNERHNANRQPVRVPAARVFLLRSEIASVEFGCEHLLGPLREPD